MVLISFDVYCGKFYGVNLLNQSTVNKGMILGQKKLGGKYPLCKKKSKARFVTRSVACSL